MNERFLVIIFFLGLMVLVVISTQFILNYVIKTKENPYKIFGIVHGCIFGVFFTFLAIGYGILEIKKDNSDAKHTSFDEEMISNKVFKVKIPEHIENMKLMIINAAGTEAYEFEDLTVRYNKEENSLIFQPNTAYEPNVNDIEFVRNKNSHIFIDFDK